MSFLNVEIKAKCQDPEFVRNYLRSHHAVFIGTDMQSDTYFNVSSGRLKLREGNIENNLIYYERNDQAGPKSSHFELIPVNEAARLKLVLEKAVGIKAVVQKIREIYYIDNVKFHIDEVPGLGSFIEIEAGNIRAKKTYEELKAQCDFYINELGIRETDLLDKSYSDLILPHSAHSTQ
jgi:predicted adenylyl cyclase CyaB